MNFLSFETSRQTNINPLLIDSPKSFNLRFLSKKLDHLLKKEGTSTALPTQITDKKIYNLNFHQSPFQRIERINHKNGFYTVVLIAPNKTESYSIDVLKSPIIPLLNRFESLLNGNKSYLNLLKNTGERSEEMSALDLSNTEVNIDELQVLFAKFPNLRYLNLAGTNLDWENFRIPANCKIVDLTGTSVTSEQAVRYQKDLLLQDLILDKCPNVPPIEHAMIRYTIAIKFNPEKPNLNFLNKEDPLFKEKFLQSMSKFRLPKKIV